MLISSVSKRKASNEPNSPAGNKRIKSSHSEEPETSDIPAAPKIVPFPVKASHTLHTWTSVLTL